VAAALAVLVARQHQQGMATAARKKGRKSYSQPAIFAVHRQQQGVKKLINKATINRMSVAMIAMKFYGIGIHQQMERNKR